MFGPLQVLGGSGSYSVSIAAKDADGNPAIRDFVGVSYANNGAWATGTGAGNAVTLTAYSAVGVQGEGDIDLSNAGNVLGDLTVKGNDVTITEGHTITDVGSGNAAGGWSTTGVTTLNSVGSPVNLDNTNNVLGPVVVNGSPNSVLITDNSDLTEGAAWHVGSAPVTLNAVGHAIDLGTSGNVLGPVDITVTNGMPTSVSITEDDGITQGSAWLIPNIPVTLNAENGNAINLASTANQMGALTVTGGTVSIVENDNITQTGAWSTGGTTTLDPRGNAVTLNNAANILGDLAFGVSGGAPASVNIAENDDITQAAGWSLPDIPITLNASLSHDVLLTQGANQLGDLKVTADNVQVVENHTITDGGAWTVAGTATFTAGGNAIVLDANPKSDFGTVSIVSASSADIVESNNLLIDGANVTGTLTIDAGGAITQSATAIVADSLLLRGTGASAVLNNATNNVANLSANFTGGGGISYTDADDFGLVTAMTVGANPIFLTSLSGTVASGMGLIAPATSALSVDTGTGLTVPTLSIAGAQEYTAGGTGILLDGSLNSTAAGNIAFNSPVTLNRDLIVASTGSAILFDATVAGNGHNLAINAGSAAVTFDGAVSGLGNSATSNAALSVTATSGATVFNGTLSANNGLLVSGPVTFMDSVTLADGGIGSTFTGLVTLGTPGGMTFSGYKYLDFNSGIDLSNGPATIQSNDYPMRFNGGSVNGYNDLTLDAGTGSNATIGGTLGLGALGSDITSLTVSAYNPTIPAAGVSIWGPQSYTAVSGSSIILNGNVTGAAFTASPITFNGPVTLGAAAVVTSNYSDITFDGTVDGNKNLTVDTGSAGAAQITFNGDLGGVTALGSGTGAALTLQGGTVAFAGTVATRSGIDARQANAVVISGDTALGNGDTGTQFGGNVTFNNPAGINLSGYDGLQFGGPVTLQSGDVSIGSGNASSIAFNSTVNGAQALTVSNPGSTTFSGRVGDSTPLASLSIEAGGSTSIDINVAGATPSIQTTGEQTFGNAVTLALNTRLSGTQVSFNSTVDGNNKTLTVDGNAQFGDGSGADTVGGSARLLSVTVSGTTSVGADAINTATDQTYNGPVTLQDGLHSFDISDSGVFWFNYAVDGVHAGLSGLKTWNHSGAGSSARFGDAVGGTTPLATVETVGSTAWISDSVTTTGNQDYRDGIRITGDTVLSAGSGDIHFYNSILDNNPAFDALTLNSSGTITIDGYVGGFTGSNQLSSLTVNGGTTVFGLDAYTSGAQTYNSAVALADNASHSLQGSSITFNRPVTGGSNSLLAVSGLTTINTASISGASQSYLSDVILGADTVLSGDGISFWGTVKSDGTNRSLTITDSGDTYLGGAVGSAVAGEKLRTLMVNGGGSSYLSGGAIISTGAQSYDNAVVLAADTTLTGANISFGSTVVSDGIINAGSGGTNRNLSVVDSGTTTSHAALGSANAGEELGSLTVSGGGITALNGGSITSTGSQSFDNAVTLGNNTVLTGSDITLAGTVNGVSSLTVNGSGVTTFGAAVGGTAPLASLTTDAAGSTVVSGGGIATSGNQNYHDQVTVSGTGTTLSTFDSNVRFYQGVTLNEDLTVTTGVGNVTFSGSVDGANDLAVHNSGQTTFSAAVGSGTPLASLTTDGGGSTALNGGALTTSGTQGYGDAVSLGADTVLTGNKIDFAQPVTGAAALTLRPYDASRSVQVGGDADSGAVLDLTSAELALLPANLTSLTIGRTDGSGNLDIKQDSGFGAVPLTLNGAGGISQTGGNLTQSGALTLFSTGAIDLANSDNSLGPIALAGAPTSVRIDDSTNLTQSAAWTLGNAPVTLNAGSHDITLTSNGNTFGTLVLNGKNADIREADATTLGASSLSGNLGLDSAGGITVAGALGVTGNASLTADGLVSQSAPLTIGGNLTVNTAAFDAGNVTLNNSAAAATTIGNTLVGEDYNLTASGHSISQATGSVAEVAGTFTPTGSLINVGNVGNIFGGLNIAGASSTALIRQNGVITLGNRSDVGNLTVISEASSATFSGTGGPTHGVDAVLLGNSANNIAGNISITTMAPSISTGGAEVQTGILQSAGTALQVAGEGSFTAAPSSAGSLGIQLINDGNSFGSLRLNGSTVDVKAFGPAAINAAQASISLTVTSYGAGAAVTQTGAIATPVLLADSDGPVTLANGENQVGSFGATAGGNVTFAAAGSFAVSGVAAGGNAVILTAGGTGSITQTGAVANVSVLVATAGGSIALSDVNNTIGSLGGLNAATGIAINDATGGLDLTGAIASTAGDVLIHTEGGDLTLADGSTVATGGSGNIYLAAGLGHNFKNNWVNNAVNPLSLGTGRYLVYTKSNTDTMLGGITGSGYMGYTWAGNPTAGIAGSDNRLLFQDQATLTFTADNLTRHYGDVNPALTYSVAGYLPGDGAGSSFSGSPTLGTATGAASNVGQYGISILQNDLFSAKGYLFNFAGGSLDVTQRPLIVTADNQSRLYGNLNPTSGSVTGNDLVNGDTLGSATVSSPALVTSSVRSYSLTPSAATFSQGQAGNYLITYADGTLNVTPRPLTVMADNQSRTYGDANPASGSVTGNNLMNGDTLGVSPVTTPALATSNVGSYALTPSAATFSAGQAGNYLISYANGSLDVTQRPLTITAGNQSRYYGNANPLSGGVTGNNLVNGDTLGTATLSSPAQVTSNVGSYTLTPSSAAFSAGQTGNYAINYADGTLNVTTRPITVTADNQSRTYGDTNPTSGAFSVGGNGLVNGDTLAASVGVSSPTLVTSNVGSYALTPSGASFTAGLAGNYSITYLDGALTVGQRPLTVTAGSQSRVYGDANPTSGAVTGNNLVNGDTLGLATVSSPALATSNVGSYSLTPSAVTFSSGQAGNYLISYVDGLLSVTQRPLTVTAGNQSRLYGDTNPTSGAVSGNNLVNGDTMGTAGVSSPALITSNVGSYTLTPSGVTFSAGQAGNYLISYADGSLSVAQRPITITAGNQSRSYGVTNPTSGSFSVEGNGLVNGDTLVATVGVVSPALATSNVGSYALTPNGVTFSAGLSDNYLVSYADGTLSVTPRPLTITAGNQSRLYGNANPTSGSVTGDNLVNGDALGAATVASPALVTSNVGSYTLTPSGASFSAGQAGNYTITYADGSLSVTPRPLTITAGNQARTYGDANPTSGAFNVGGSGLVNGDTLSAAVGVTSPALVVSNVGSYALTPNGVIFTAGQSGNYQLSYLDGTLSVTPRPLTVSAGNQSRTYGDANPTSGAVVGNNLVNGDTLGFAALTTPALMTSNVGSYTLTPSGAAFSSGQDGNYLITYADGSLNVTPRPLTVTANNQSRLYGDTNPTSGGVTGNNLVNGDTLGAATVTTLAQVTSNVGSYGLAPGAISFDFGQAGNYTITYADGALAVTPRPVSITGTRSYNGSNLADAGIFTLGNLVPGETLTLTGNGFLESKNVVTDGPVIVGTLALADGSGQAGNYTLSGGSKAATITPATLTISASGVDKVYDATRSAMVVFSDNRFGSDQLTVSGSALFDDKNAGAGKPIQVSGISLSGADAGNYTFNTAASTAATISPKSLTVSSITAQDRVYDGTTSAVLTGGVITSGVIPGDAVTISSLSGRFSDGNVGNDKQVTCSGGNLGGADGLNYQVTSPDTAIASITPRPLTITPDAASRVYGEASPAYGTVSGDNLAPGDTLGVSPVTTPAQTTSNVGTYALTPNVVTFSAGLAGNYLVSYADGTLSVTPRPLTITAGNQSRLYGNANPTSGSVTGDNLVNGDALGAATVASPALVTSNVGSYTLTPSGASFSAGQAGNYTITYADGSLSVTPRPLTITAGNQARTYGDANPTSGAFNVGGSGLVNGDTLSAAVGVTSPALVVSNVGSYALTPNGVIFTAGQSGNYQVSYLDGTLSVTPRPLTVSADNQSRTYGDANPTSGTVVGNSLVNGDTLGFTTLTTPAQTTSNAGSYTLVPGTASFINGSSSNYAISYTNGILTVTPRPVTVTADQATKVYGGDDPVLGYSAEISANGRGLLAGDIMYGSLNRSAGENVGNYSIGQGSLNNPNYTITYTGNSLNITSAPLTVTADGKIKVYGSVDPALTFSFSGLQLSDTASVFSGSLNRTSGENVGSYAINQNTLSAGGNYTIVYSGSNLGITKAPLTVVADNQSSKTGETLPVLTAHYDGLVANDGPGVVSGLAITTPATSLSPVGIYDIAPSGGSAANYNLSYVNGTLTMAAPNAGNQSLSNSEKSATSPMENLPGGQVGAVTVVNTTPPPALVIANNLNMDSRKGVVVEMETVLENPKQSFYAIPAEVVSKLPPVIEGTASASLPSGAGLPGWISFDKQSLSFSFAAAPADAFPLEVVVNFTGHDGLTHSVQVKISANR